MVQSIQKDGCLAFSFSGRLDTIECARIEGDVTQQTEGTGLPVIFDLAGVEFVSSAFLRLCMMVQRKAAGSKLSLINVSPTIKKVFKISGLDALVVS